MRLDLRDLKTFALYFIAGSVGLSTAVYVSTVLMKRTLAQNTPPAEAQQAAPPSDQGLPPLPDPNAAPEMPPSMPPTQAAPPAPAPDLGPPPALPPADLPPPQQERPQVGGQQQEPATLRSLLEGIIEDFNYEVSGRRDPFLPYTSPKAISVEEEEEIVSPLQRFELDQLRLIGIIWDTKKPKAMFLDPAGKGYIVGKLDKVGRNRGYIAEIREGEVIILERYVGEGRSTFQTRSIRLERD